MTDKKRGRPALPEAEKRQQIGVRTSATLKADLERAAAENGRSVAQEAELRLIQSFERERISGSADTDRLLASLAAEIALIERQTGKRWWRDVMTWAAVAEALRDGPIQRMKPDQPHDDDVVRDAWDAAFAIYKAKAPLLERLRAAGINAETNPKHANAGDSTLGRLISLGINDRAQEKAQIAALYAEGADRAALETAADELATLDREERKALEGFRSAMKPYLDAEQRGVEAYRALDDERRARADALANLTA